MPEALIGCPVSNELAEHLRQTIDGLREAPDQMPRDDVVELIVALTETGFDYHFQRPLRSLGVGPTARKSVDYGLKGAVRVIRTSMRRVIRGLDTEYYARLADFLEDAYFPEA